MSDLRAILATGLLFALGAVVSQGKAQAESDWVAAENAIVRLPPAAFAELPNTLVTHLTQFGCSVPQSYLSETPHNVIEGQFQRPGQTDWAVLCHRDGLTSLFVFWEGAPDRMEELETSEDRGYLQTIDGEGTIGYSHAILAAGKDAILTYYEAFGGPTPPDPLDHEGISNAFLEKASRIFYWHDGDWLELAGAD